MRGDLPESSGTHGKDYNRNGTLTAGELDAMARLGRAEGFDSPERPVSPSPSLQMSRWR